MKTTLCLLTCIVLHSSLHAATWRVDNNTSHPADYRTIQEAVDAAAVGDTILVAGSNDAYAGFELTKRLNIKGERASTVGLGTRVESLHLTEVFNDVDPNHLRNASGSLLEGLDCDGSSIDVFGPCSAVTIKRCIIGAVNLRGCSGALVINCQSSNVSTADVIMDGGRRFIGTGSSIIGSKVDSLLFSYSTNALVENCVIGTYVGAGSDLGAIQTSSTSTAPFVIRNSILIAKTSLFSDPSDTEGISKANFDHCLLISDSTLPAGNGNINRTYINFPSIFVDATPNSTNPDGFVLKAGSPAIGAGIAGVDLGMYGGASPFVKDFIPALPRVNYMAVPPVVPNATGLTFEVRAEARD